MREYDASLRDYKKYLDAAVDDPSVPTADRQTANSEMAEVIQLIKIKDQKEAAAQESKRYENSSKAWGKKASEFYEKREGPRQVFDWKYYLIFIYVNYQLYFNLFCKATVRIIK